MTTISTRNRTKAQARRLGWWLEALRDGSYKQTKGVLHGSDGGFCCMGVAIDSCLNGEWVKKEDKWVFESAEILPRNRRYSLALSDKEMLRLYGPGIPRITQLAEWNDAIDGIGHKTFGQIAEAIELSVRAWDDTH